VKPGPEFELPRGAHSVETGPVRVELDGATLYIPTGWVGVRDGPTWTVTRT
jgi:hypothetical protein